MHAVRKLLIFIDDNAVENPPLSEIAAQIGYSVWYCSEQFHRLTGMTIREYMAKRRICIAAEALRDTDKPITDIAFDSGSSSQQAPTRAFGRAFGCTPMDYRKNPGQYPSTILKEVNDILEFRKIFDTIPEQFDRYRPRYSAELFDSLIRYAEIGPGKSVLELGPGTGQATDPILDTGCDYHAIELGENLCEMMKRKYGHRPNFRIVNGDFITHDFGKQTFDLIYSAATIQWIPEEIAFSKTFSLLKPGGTLAMMLTRGDYRTPNEELYQKIQQVYSAYFKPETAYMHGKFRYDNAPAYGYTDFEKREFFGKREFSHKNL
jgi:AraC-like DNA-binding protein/phospholipid N-methyltransferase